MLSETSRSETLLFGHWKGNPLATARGSPRVFYLKEENSQERIVKLKVL